ncbi:MAG: hypothetical protein WKF78_13825 [Candidatus Limnocylindrales bacterium]
MIASSNAALDPASRGGLRGRRADRCTAAVIEPARRSSKEVDLPVSIAEIDASR